MKLPWPTKQKIDAFVLDTIDTIGRPVEFHYVASVSGCSVCSLNPVTGESTDAFCPVCSGNYWIDVMETATISGHVTWKYSEDLAWYTGGQQMMGDGQVRINYSVSGYDIITKTKYIVVDDKEMQVNRINLRGSPDVNRIIISLLQKEE